MIHLRLRQILPSLSGETATTLEASGPTPLQALANLEAAAIAEFGDEAAAAFDEDSPFARDHCAAIRVLGDPHNPEPSIEVYDFSDQDNHFVIERRHRSVLHTSDLGPEWDIPADLCPLGRSAAIALRQLCVENNLTHTGGTKVFHSPAEWRKRGEEYGTDSLLICVHDGAECKQALDFAGENYPMVEAFNRKLDELGLLNEPQRGWFSAIYQPQPVTPQRERVNNHETR